MERYVFRAHINHSNFIIVDNDIKIPLIPEVETAIYENHDTTAQTLALTVETVLDASRSDCVLLSTFVEWLDCIAKNEYSKQYAYFTSGECNEDVKTVFTGYYNILDFIFKFSLLQAGFMGR